MRGLPGLLFVDPTNLENGLPSTQIMKSKMKRFLLVAVAACVAMDLVVLWMLR